MLGTFSGGMDFWHAWGGNRGSYEGKEADRGRTDGGVWSALLGLEARGEHFERSASAATQAFSSMAAPDQAGYRCCYHRSGGESLVVFFLISLLVLMLFSLLLLFMVRASFAASLGVCSTFIMQIWGFLGIILSFHLFCRVPSLTA